MTALLILMGISAFSTLFIVTAMGLAARRPIPEADLEFATAPTLSVFELGAKAGQGKALAAAFSH